MPERARKTECTRTSRHSYLFLFLLMCELKFELLSPLLSPLFSSPLLFSPLLSSTPMTHITLTCVTVTPQHLHPHHLYLLIPSRKGKKHIDRNRARWTYYPKHENGIDRRVKQVYQCTDIDCLIKAFRRYIGIGISFTDNGTAKRRKRLIIREGDHFGCLICSYLSQQLLKRWEILSKDTLNFVLLLSQVLCPPVMTGCCNEIIKSPCEIWQCFAKSLNNLKCTTEHLDS